MAAIFVLCLPVLAPAAATVTLAKSAGNTSPQVGETYRYNIVVNVPSGGPATAVTVTDALPAGLQFVGASAGGSYAAGTVTWNLGSLACTNVVLTMTAFADSGGSWGSFGQVAANDASSALSTLINTGPGCNMPRHSNWFYLTPLSGYSVNSVNSVKLYYRWHADNSDQVFARFQNTCDLSTGTFGPLTLVNGLNQAADQLEVWDVTALGGPWTFNKLQCLTPYIQHECGGTGTHNVWMNQIYAVADFNSCGTSVWVDVVPTNALANGQVVNNTAQVSGSNFGTVSASAPVTVQAPTLSLTKTAKPSLAAPGDTIEYTLQYQAYGTGLNVFDDFNSNYGPGPIPAWLSAGANQYEWVNSNGVLHFDRAGGYDPYYRTDTPDFSEGVVSMDFQIDPVASGSNTQSASLMYLYQTTGANAGKFYKSKVYPCGGSPSGYCVDVQTGPSWLQVCGNANIPAAAWNAPPAWNNIKVKIHNYTFTVYINGVQVFYCDDPTDYLSTPGKAGIFADGGNIWYDNYHIGSDMLAKSVRVWDSLPACMTYVSSSPTASLVAGDYLRWDLGDLDIGQKGSITVRASSSGCPVGTQVNNAASQGDNAQPVAASTPVAFIQPLTKSASASTVAAGDTFTYSIAYTATGGGTVLSDDFADGVWNSTWTAHTWTSGGDSNITTAFVESGGVITGTHWGPDILTMLGSSGTDGRVQASVGYQAGATPGLIFGYQGSSYYSVVIKYGYNTFDDALELHYYNGATDTVLQSLTGLELGNSSPRLLAVTRAGNQFVVNIDGVYWGTLSDAANNLPGPGLQGIFSAQSGNVFDNFKWEPDYRANVQIWDTLPVGLTLLTATAGTFSAGVAKWTLPPAGLAPGQSWTVQAVVVASGTVCGAVPNTAVGGLPGKTWSSAGPVGVLVTCGSPTPTRTPSPTPSRTASPSPSASPTETPSPSPSRTASPSPSATRSASPSATPTASPSASATASATPSPSPSASPTVTRSASPSATPSATHSPTQSPGPTATFTATLTASPTVSPTRTPTASPTGTGSVTESPTISNSATATMTRSATPTATSSSTASPTQSPGPSATDTATLTASPTVTPSATATATRSATPTATPSATHSPTQSPGPSATDTATLTASPTVTPSATATATRSATPTATPSSTASPTQSPGPSATDTSTLTPSPSPTGTWSVTESPTISNSPSATQTASPSRTASPSVTPSPSPTASPSPTPSRSPSPTWTPSASPSPSATVSPSRTPSLSATPSPLPMPNWVSVSVYNAAGERVRRLYEGAAQALPGSLQLSSPILATGDSLAVRFPGILDTGSATLLWNGSNDAGQSLAGGSYSIKAEVRDPWGQVTALLQSVQLIPAGSRQSLRIFNSAGELVREIVLAAPVGGASRLDLGGEAFAFEPDPGTGAARQPLKIDVVGSAGSSSQAWDGLTGTGVPATGGSYLVQLVSLEGGQESVITARSVTLIKAADSAAVLDSLRLAPNPVGPDQAAALYYDPALAAGWSVEALVYDLAGGLVGWSSDPSASGRLSLVLGPRQASGVYLVRVRLSRGGAAWQVRVLKLAYLR